MLSRLITLLLVLLTTWHVQAQGYIVSLDLTNRDKDRVSVNVQLPPMRKAEVNYFMPVMVPGVYMNDRYGKLIRDFKAFDKNGEELKTKRVDRNYFRISKAEELTRVSYTVGDNFERTDFIFRPAGTEFEDDHFLLNLSGMVGYVEGFQFAPYEVEITYPEKLYGATAMKVVKRSAGRDRYQADNYAALADNPIFFMPPDTASHMVGDTRIEVAVYSSSGKVKAEQINEIIKPLSEATASFLEYIPVKKYSYLFYFTNDNKWLSRMNQGALEHHHSSVYYLREPADGKVSPKGIQSIAAHEFLHILTPLHVHSQEISDFRFHDPQMSRHLWLYEGVTEYLSMRLLLHAGLITESEFRNGMTSKINSAAQFKPYSITEMSQTVIDGKGPLRKMKKGKIYSDVYQKGAVLAFLLDIRLNALSKGEEPLLYVLNHKLMRRYGKDVPFDDAGFIKDFYRITYPELESFFTNYVEGGEALPLEEDLSKLGWRYHAPGEEHFTYLKKTSFSRAGAEGRYSVYKPGKNAFGFMSADVLLEVDGTQPQIVEDLYPMFYAEEGATIQVKVKRGDLEMILTGGKPFKVKSTRARIDGRPKANEGRSQVHQWMFE